MQTNFINLDVFNIIERSAKKVLIVTKYWDKNITNEIWKEIQNFNPETCIGIGENRIEKISEKGFPREQVHFIGNIQSKKITQIVEHCQTIHSLGKLSHAEKIESLGKKTQAFVQIRLDENKDIGISAEQLPNFLQACKNMKHLEIIGISGMGSAYFDEANKRKEFRILKNLRDTYLPNGSISAGTSRDYILALEEGIDIVRVGTGAIKKQVL